MQRFIKDADYDVNVKAEIKRLLIGEDGSEKQLAAEARAVAMITNYLGGRYDMEAVFTELEERNDWMIHVVLVIALYFLYHQTGMKDIPQHRLADYEDVLDWLKKAGAGDIPANLPPLPEDAEKPSEIRFNARKPKNHKW